MNPCSVLLSGCMMFEYMGWNGVSECITQAISKTIASKIVTIDFYNLMEGATLLKTSEFADAVIGEL